MSLAPAGSNGGSVKASRGSFQWSKQAGSAGAAELVGMGAILQPSLGIEVLVRKNVDPKIPAAMMMEIRFASSTSADGNITNLTDIRATNEELGRGGKLIGATARIEKNFFLLALSAAPDAVAKNAKLLSSRRWLHLDITFSDGKSATVSLERTSPARALLDGIIATWGKPRA
jgi:hypothetical protein